MILNINNLGTVKSASIDLSKKLTLFCGKNSTGKTYVYLRTILELYKEYDFRRHR